MQLAIIILDCGKQHVIPESFIVATADFIDGLKSFIVVLNIFFVDILIPVRQNAAILCFIKRLDSVPDFHQFIMSQRMPGRN